jgi:hypothetical protein
MQSIRMSVFIWQYNMLRTTVASDISCVLFQNGGYLKPTSCVHWQAIFNGTLPVLKLVTPLLHQNNSTQKKDVLYTRSAWDKSQTTALWSQIHLLFFERISLFFRFSLFLPSLECTRVLLLMPGDWLSNHVNPKPGFPPQACRHASSLIKRAYSAIYVSSCLHPLNPEDALGRKLKQTVTNKAHKYHTPINSRTKNMTMKRCKIWHTDTEKLLSMESVLIWMRKNTHTDFV